MSRIIDISNTRPLSFVHGVHPEEYKELTTGREIERMPFVSEFRLPLSQHIGSPSIPIVKKGQQVKRGEKIANPGGYVSVALHSPVDGMVSDIGLYTHPNGKESETIVIEKDAFSPQLLVRRPTVDPFSLKLEEFIGHVQDAGIVGLGGAAFPAHVKFNLPEGKHCSYLMVNGCECEPFLTADDRLMVEYGKELLDGIEILNHFLQSDKIYIAIELNKPEAIQKLQELCNDRGGKVQVIPLKVKYPQGAEKMMIKAILGKEVPSGKLPLDLGVLVSNVGTLVSIAQYFQKGQPLIERVVTVTGTAMQRPANVLVPIGTPMEQLVEWCGGMASDTARILLGGPMMGMVQKRLDVPVIKGTSGILALSEDKLKDLTEYNCIRCGRCLDACPLYLNPSLLGLLAKKGLWEEMESNHVMDCFECGSCSFVCPSSIPLVQSFRVAKGFIREQTKE